MKYFKFTLAVESVGEHDSIVLKPHVVCELCDGVLPSVKFNCRLEDVNDMVSKLNREWDVYWDSVCGNSGSKYKCSECGVELTYMESRYWGGKCSGCSEVQ